MIELNMKKTLQVLTFSFIILNIAEKAVLHCLIVMLGCIKSALRKKQLLTSKAEHLKGKSSKH